MLLDELKWVTEFIGHNLSNIPVHLDLAELRGYHYHTGMVFSLLAPGFGHEIAKGGRYDDIGKSFGYARPATGFSADLRQIIKLVHGGRSSRRFAIAAPAQEDRQLKETIASLRQQVERVICRLPQQSIEELLISCDRQLVMRAGKWQVEAGVDGS